jgi:anaerobic dimethyl sulfoxide reductase subunit A
VGKAWHSESVAYPYDEFANIWYASIKSDRWAHCVLNYPNLKREEIGLWPRDDQLDGLIPNIRGIFWQGSDWFNQLTNINKEIQAIKKLKKAAGVHGLDHHAVRHLGRCAAAHRHALRAP